MSKFELYKSKVDGFVGVTNIVIVDELRIIGELSNWLKNAVDHKMISNLENSGLY